MALRKPLTHHRQAEGAKPESKPYKLNAGDGLFLQIMPTGTKRWRFRYFFEGKEQMLSMGLFPDVGLLTAKEAVVIAKKQIAVGINPSLERKNSTTIQALEQEDLFENVAQDWLSHQTHREKSTLDKARWLLGFAISEFGNVQIDQISPSMVLVPCRKLEKQGKHETAKRVKMKVGQVFRYAVALGKVDRDPTADLRGVLTPPRVNHRAAIVDPVELGQLLRDIDTYQGHFTTLCAMKLAALLFVRPGELRSIKWSDIDLNSGIWSYTPPKTKNQTAIDLMVPLARQAINILSELHNLTGGMEFVFASSSAEGFLSEATVLNALKRLGYRGLMTGHGFRATARTLLDEQLGFRVEYIEMQLGHEVRDVHGRAYNRTKFLPERIVMMQAWADYLDEIKKREK